MDKRVTYDYSKYLKRDHDFTITIDSNSFLVHKECLSRCSKYFNAMFNLDMREKHENVVHLKETDTNILKVLIDYCYSGHLSCMLPEIFEAAHQYAFSEAENIIINHHKEVSLNNYFNALEIWTRSLHAGLGENISIFCAANFPSVMEHEDFVHLDEEYLHELLRHDDLYAKDEEIVIEAILKWISFDEQERKRKFQTLMADCVRFFRIDTDRLACLLVKFEHSTFRDLISQAYNYRRMYDIMNHTGLYFHNEKFKKRCIDMLDYIFVVGGCCGSRQQSVVCEKYNIKGGFWEEIPPMKEPRNYLQALVIGDSLYAIGGSFYKNRLKSVERYDISKNTWHSDVPDMLYERSQFAIGFCDKSIYCFGGRDEAGNCTDRVEKFCLKRRKWIRCANMLTARCSFEVCLVDGKFLAFGGIDNDFQKTRQIECYNPRRNKWYQKGNMPSGRTNFGCYSCDEFIFFAGDQDAKYIECLNVKTMEWLDPSTHLGFFGPLKVKSYKGDCAFFLSDSSDHELKSRLEVLDLRTMSICPAEPMLHPRKSFGVAIYITKP